MRVNAAVSSETIAAAVSWRFPKNLRAAGTQAFVTRGKSIKAEMMADLLNLVMLICACIGSMAFGILVAYGILRVGFGLMRRQPRPVAVKPRPQVARVL
jgi:hypothetical protein